MRECVWAGFFLERRARYLSGSDWFGFYFIFCPPCCLLNALLVYCGNAQWAGELLGEWQVEAEEHGLVFCWVWLSGSHWLPDSFCPRRPSWRKPDKNEKRTPRGVGWTGVSGKNTAEYNGHRKITVHRRPRNLARGPATSYSSVSWLLRNTWTAGPWRLIGKWWFREECSFFGGGLLQPIQLCALFVYANSLRAALKISTLMWPPL